MYQSNLHYLLSNNIFTVTAEIGPPKGSDGTLIKDKAELLRKSADAFNVTDNQTAVVRLSSIAAACLVKQMGLDPVLQLSCRDRNRIALQSEVLGASAIGVHNMLCITGDHQSLGNHPHAAGVFDLDSIQFVQMIKHMRDKAIFENGERISKKPPKMYIGAVSNPFSDPVAYRILRLEKKIKAGADFIQTQSVFDVHRFQDWMEEIVEIGLDKKVHILAGITPLKSVKMMKRMKYHVPGVIIPDEIERKMVQAEDAKQAGFSIACELIDEIKKIDGVHGIHITALFWEQIIPSLVKETNLLPRPSLTSTI